MVEKLITSNFFVLSVILFITFSTTDVLGYKNCRSTSFFERDTICRDSEYCCGTYQNKCCYSNTSSEYDSNGSEAIALILVLAILIGCPLCCCWCCCRKTKNPGVIYNPVAAVPPAAGGSQPPAQRPAEVSSAMKSPYPLQPNPYPQQPPYPGQQPPYPGQQPPYQQLPYPGQQPPYPAHQIPYPLQPMPYPQQAPYNANIPPYPPQQPTYPTPYPPQQAPYPTNPTPYPPQSAQQTLSPSGLENLYPPQEATNPYFKMPPPAYNESMQQSGMPNEPGHVDTAAHHIPTAPPP